MTNCYHCKKEVKEEGKIVCKECTERPNTANDKACMVNIYKTM